MARLGALAACTAIVAGTGVAATPAHAAGPVVRVVADRAVSLPETADDPGNPVFLGWLLEKDGAETAEDVKVIFDLTDVADFAKTDLNCPNVGAVYTCDRGDIDDPSNSGGIVKLIPTDGADLGDTGTVEISGTSTNGEVVSATTKVTVGSPDLALGRLPDRNVKIGTTHENEITITNNGTLPADGIVLRLRATPGLGYPDEFSNCTYATVPEPMYNARSEALCRFDTVIEPGQTFALDQPVGLEIETNALFEIFDYEVQLADSTLGRTLARDGKKAGGTKGDGERLSLKAAGTAERRAAEPDLADNHRRQSLDADSGADLVAVGDSAKGKPGDEVSVTATLRNAGPGWVGIHGSDDQPALLVTIPKGTKAVRVPEDCSVWNIDGPAGPGVPGKPQYICAALPRFLDAGAAYSFDFTLKIGKDAKGAKDTSGTARATTVYGSTLDFDKDHGNDTAKLTVRVPGSGSDSSGGSGSAGASGSSGGNDPGAQSTGGTSAGSTGSTGGSGSGGSAGGGGLATTGSSGMPLVAGAAAGAAALGGALFLAMRRRRTAEATGK